MAQKISVLLLDDLDGESEAVDTILFGLDGTNYEIDLSVEHADEFRDFMAKYVGAARKGQAPSLRARTGSAPRSTNSEAATIRTWARENGITVPERGRLPLDVVEQYRTRGSGTPVTAPGVEVVEPEPESPNGEVQAEDQNVSVTEPAETQPETVVDVTDKPKRSRAKKADAEV